jgi:hypothetical protein
MPGLPLSGRRVEGDGVSDSRSITLLVVEDELLIRMDMVSLLEQRGFVVLQAADAD